MQNGAIFFFFKDTLKSICNYFQVSIILLLVQKKNLHLYIVHLHSDLIILFCRSNHVKIVYFTV